MADYDLNNYYGAGSYGYGYYGNPQFNNFLRQQSFGQAIQRQRFQNDQQALYLAQMNKKESGTGAAVTAVGGLAIIGTGIYLAFTKRGQKATQAIKNGFNKLLGKIKPSPTLDKIASNTIKDGVNQKYADRAKGFIQRASSLVTDKNAVNYEDIVVKGNNALYKGNAFSGIAKQVNKNGQQVFRQYENGVLKNAYHISSDKCLVCKHFDKSGKVVSYTALTPKKIQQGVLENGKFVTKSKVESAAKTKPQTAPNTKPTEAPKATAETPKPTAETKPQTVAETPKPAAETKPQVATAGADANKNTQTNDFDFKNTPWAIQMRNALAKRAQIENSVNKLNTVPDLLREYNRLGIKVPSLFSANPSQKIALLQRGLIDAQIKAV